MEVIMKVALLVVFGLFIYRSVNKNFSDELGSLLKEVEVPKDEAKKATSWFEGVFDKDQKIGSVLLKFVLAALLIGGQIAVEFFKAMK